MMKKCPQCGKESSDYAKKCKYCDHDIPSYEPEGTTVPTALLCPACGGSLVYDGTSPSIICSHCGNAVIVPSRLRAREEPAIPWEEQNLPLSQQVEQLLQDGHSDKAIELLRRHLSIQQSDAEKVIEIMESGNYGDAKQLFNDAMQGKLK